MSFEHLLEQKIHFHLASRTVAIRSFHHVLTKRLLHSAIWSWVVTVCLTYCLQHVKKEEHISRGFDMCKRAPLCTSRTKRVPVTSKAKKMFHLLQFSSLFNYVYQLNLSRHTRRTYCATVTQGTIDFTNTVIKPLKNGILGKSASQMQTENDLNDSQCGNIQLRW